MQNLSSETNEYLCPNSNGELRYFQNNNRIDSYCPRVQCCWSSNYSNEFLYPYEYFKTNGKSH